MGEKFLQDSVAWWETFVLIFSILAAVATFVSAVCGFLSYVWNRRRRNAISEGIEIVRPMEGRASLFEKLFQGTALVAVTITLFGVIGSVRYTIRNHQLGEIQAVARRDLANQVVEASNKANAAMHKESETASQLTSAYNDLATAKQRLNRVEKESAPRRISPTQRKQMVAILSKYSQFDIIPFPVRHIAINPLAGDWEIHDFGSQLKSVFTQAGWVVGWAEVMVMGETESIRPTEGLMLQVRSPEDDPQFRAALETALKIVSPVVLVDYKSDPVRAIHILVGKKPSPSQ